MANYVSKCRTNYFAVMDVEKFTDIMKHLSGDGEIDFYEHASDKGKYMFYCDGVLNGYMNDPDDDDSIDDATGQMIKELQAILPDGEAIILTEAGSEKMNYISCVATIITNNTTGYVNLYDVALEKARTILGNPEYNTQLDY